MSQRAPPRRVEQRPDVVEVAQIVAVERPHHRAAVGLDLDQPCPSSCSSASRIGVRDVPKRCASASARTARRASARLRGSPPPADPAPDGWCATLHTKPRLQRRATNIPPHCMQCVKAGSDPSMGLIARRSGSVVRPRLGLVWRFRGLPPPRGPAAAWSSRGRPSSSAARGPRAGARRLGSGGAAAATGAGAAADGVGGDRRGREQDHQEQRDRQVGPPGRFVRKMPATPPMGGRSDRDRRRRRGPFAPCRRAPLVAPFAVSPARGRRDLGAPRRRCPGPRGRAAWSCRAAVTRSAARRRRPGPVCAGGGGRCARGG